jgi:hypothetical protein
MLAWGVRLDLPLQTETVDGCTVYTVNEGDLVACFSEGITDKVVATMAEKSPLRVLSAMPASRKMLRKSTSTSSLSKPWIGPTMMRLRISE